VKRLCAHILIAAVLFNSMSMALCEVCKVHILIHHYLEHVDRDSQTTFHDFLAMHYCEEDIDNSDHEKHTQLPFKKFDHKVAADAFFSALYIEIPLLISVYHVNEYPSTNDFFYLNSNLSSLFRPPRV
jgi:hypothetical protein